MRVPLSESDREFINEVAEKRSEQYSDFGYNQTIRADKAHRQGVAGEFAVGKILDCDVSTEVCNGDDGYDLIEDIDTDGKPERIDVKASRQHYNRVMVNEKVLREKKADAFVFVHICDSHIDVRGWCSRSALLENEHFEYDGVNYRRISGSELQSLPMLSPCKV